MHAVKDFYERVWEEYADPRYHPITAEGLKVQAKRLRVWTNQHRPRAVLDLGCGPAPAIEPDWAPLVVSADLIIAMLSRLRGRDRYRLVCADAGALPFEARTFDLVWCGLLVDHIAEVRPWIHELLRVLTPGGTLGMASWQRSRLPLERYPENKMRFTLSTGQELLVPSYPTWEEALAVLAEVDPEVHPEAYPIVPDEYVLEIALMRGPDTP